MEGLIMGTEMWKSFRNLNTHYYIKNNDWKYISIF